MGTIANKLEYLNDTKEIFKNKLNSIGAEIDNSTKFRDYINILDDIYDKANAASEYELEGDTKQTTYSGIQLFDIDGTVESGTLVKYNNGLKLTGNLVNEMVKFDLPEELSPSTDYTIKLDIVKNTLQTDPTLRVTLYDSTLGSEVSVTEFTASGSQTISLWRDSCDKISFSISAPEEEGAEMIIDNIILAKGTPSSITYEPYVGGKASPNPDYPQNIEVVTGRQEIDVVGKNLFDNTIQPISNQGSTLVSVESINTGKKMIYNGINSVNYLWKVFTIMDLTNYVGKTIRFKCNFTASGSNIPQVNIGLCNADGSNRTSKASTKISGNTISFIVPALVGEQKYLSVLLYINEQGTIAKDDYVDFTDMILTIDNEDMTYEPYKGQSYEINLGKNLFDISTVDYTNKCTLSNEVYTTDTLIVGDRNVLFGYRANNNYTIYPNETYYFSVDMRLTSGTSKNMNAFRFSISGGTTTMITNPDYTNEFQRYLCSWTNNTSTPIQVGRILFQPSNTNLDNAVFEIKNVMISKSNNIDYAQYKAPIELCKINDYKDRIFRGKGVNLAQFDTTQDTSKYTYSSFTAENISVEKTATGGSFYASFVLHIPKAGVYYLKGNNSSNQQLYIYTDRLWGTLKEKFSVSTTGDFARPTTFDSAGDYVIGLYGSALGNYSVKNFMCTTISDTPYEPYNSKGKWLLHKEIGKQTDYSTIAIGRNGQTTNYNQFYIVVNEKEYGTSNFICDKFSINQSMNAPYQIWGRTNSNNIVFNLAPTDCDYTINAVRTWLQTNQPIFYYALATPTTIEITDTELTNQLEAVKDYLFDYYLDEQFLLDYSDPEIIIK